MRTTLGWILITFLLIAVPAAAQETPSPDARGWPTAILDEIEEIPILGWLVGLVIDEKDTDKPEPQSPTPPAAGTALLGEGTDAEVHGGWDPDG